MLTDYWVITQLLIQVSTLLIGLGAVYYGVRIIAGWDEVAVSEKQLQLERQTYLVSSVVRFALLFQLFSLILFMVTVNIHIPPLIKGAMCAQGVLSVNEYGYPLLYLKVLAVFLYVLFLSMNYLDDREPTYPLTPLKYWLIPPIAIILLVELLLMYLFFAGITPDIITTCCSVAFSDWGDDTTVWTLSEEWIDYLLWVFGGLYITILLLNARKGIAPYWTLLIGVGYVVIAILLLKLHFVKYIYGLPSHLCLYDIFLSQYHYVGFGLFLSYYILLSLLIFKNCLYLKEGTLRYSYSRLKTRIDYFIYILTSLIILIPMLYWILWEGKL
ncbi:hypothetical protein [Algivirga pacifica]|uniref:Uncharacterized protein n=1 Tax=Algivirga pacifica TaxID=1162670 RepID=A0ABP9D542_9BACT